MAELETRHTRSELLRRAAALGIGVAGLSWLPPRGKASAATEPVLVSREESLAGAHGLLSAERTLAPRAAPPFTLVGLHWQGPGAVWFRSRFGGGEWGAWQRAVTHELPDTGTEGIQGWHLGTPVWTGAAADGIQYRLDGRIERLRAHFVNSRPWASRPLASATQPFVVLRPSWGADESIVRGDPSYADRLTLAVVHHTAGSTPASPEESAAVVRAIQIYHVKSNGWKDIGYNFVVDPFGQVLEGRAGGIDRNVIGAHALGFNTGSVGVALLGNFEKKSLTPEAETALEALLAWRLDVAHLDPVSRVGFPSNGTVHDLRAVSGHRDVNSTACPGENLYPLLDEVAGAAAQLGLPKLYEPSARANSKGAYVFRARLSESLPWTVTVTDAKGAQVAAGAGNGLSVDWTWPASQAAPGVYRYVIAAGAAVRPATGRLSLGGAPVPPEEPPPPPPPRPAGVPKRIPRWAWELRVWHLTPKAERGPRPSGAPKRLPAWYWPWFNWQQELARWKDQYGNSV